MSTLSPPGQKKTEGLLAASHFPLTLNIRTEIVSLNIGGTWTPMDMVSWSRVNTQTVSDSDMKHKSNILLTFFVLSLNLISQTPDIEIREKYVIYKLDTFNRKNDNNLLFGKGLALYIDTIKTSTGPTMVMVEQSGKFVDSMPGSVKLQIDTHIVGKGYYNDNMKVGVWHYSTKENIDEPDAKVTYERGKIVDIICYSDSSKQIIVFKTKKVQGTLKLFWLNPKTGRFQESNLDMLVDVFHFK